MLLDGNENDDECDNDIHGHQCDNGNVDIGDIEAVVKNINGDGDVNVDECDITVDAIANERVVIFQVTMDNTLLLVGIMVKLHAFIFCISHHFVAYIIYDHLIISVYCCLHALRVVWNKVLVKTEECLKVE